MTIYRIDIRHNDESMTMLVEAESLGHARLHAKSLTSIRKATQQDLVTLLGQGIAVEGAAADAAGDLTIQEG